MDKADEEAQRRRKRLRKRFLAQRRLTVESDGIVLDGVEIDVENRGVYGVGDALSDLEWRKGDRVFVYLDKSAR